MGVLIPEPLRMTQPALGMDVLMQMQPIGRAINVQSEVVLAMNHKMISDAFIKNSVFQIKWRRWMCIPLCPGSLWAVFQENPNTTSLFHAVSLLVRSPW